MPLRDSSASVCIPLSSIVSSENRFEQGQQEVRFSLKPHKVFLFDRESEERV